MKHLLLTIATLSTIIMSSAEARSLKPTLLSATLKMIHIDPNSYLADERISSGSIQVNHAEKIIELQLNRKWYCPPGRFCTMEMPAPIFIRLPLTSVTRGECASVIYEAKEDKRPVDGSLQVLTVVDNSNFYKHCKTVRAVASTEIHYETESSGMGGHVGKTHSSFTADKLQPGFRN